MRQEVVPFDADRPRGDPRDDRLGYAAFARHLADMVHHLRSRDAVVFGIHGPWGMGKSTFLNFFCHYLQEAPPPAPRPAIVNFNPWWFRGDEDLLRGFLQALASALGDHEEDEEIARRLVLLADWLSGLANPSVSLGGLLAKSVVGAKGAEDATLDKAKERIARLLEARPQRVVVIIDDIDRLSKEQIRTLFRIVKVVASFPNVLYVLAFDRDAVAAALSEHYPGHGRDFLEKIIHAPFELPAPDAFALAAWLRRELRDVPGANPADLRGAHAAETLEALGSLVQTPREVVRFVNTLRITYPPVASEVNLADFAGLEAIRLTHPAVYEAIRRAPGMFAGSSGGLGARELDALVATHEAWEAELPRDAAAALRRLVPALFPRVARVWGGPVYAAASLPTWRRAGRVASPEVLPVAMAFSIAPGAVTKADMENVLAVAHDPEEVRLRLLSLRRGGAGRMEAFFRRMEDYPPSAFGEAACVGLALAASLMEDEQFESVEDEEGIFSTRDLFLAMSVEALRALGHEVRGATMERMTRQGRSLPFLTDLLDLARARDEDEEEDDRLLPPAQRDRLVAALTERVRDALTRGTVPADAASALVRWWREADEEGLAAWTRAAFETQEGVRMVLARFVHVGETAGRDPSEVPLFTADVPVPLDPAPLVALAASPDATAEERAKVHALLARAPASQAQEPS